MMSWGNSSKISKTILKTPALCYNRCIHYQRKMISLSKAFQRRKEDFRCEHCGESITGNGYTNHCPKCLYSRHVDIHPGDRAAECGGLMEPIFLEREKGEQKLTHRCIVCGYEKKNKASAEDDFEALVVLAKKIAERK